MYNWKEIIECTTHSYNIIIILTYNQGKSITLVYNEYFRIIYSIEHGSGSLGVIILLKHACSHLINIFSYLDEVSGLHYKWTWFPFIINWAQTCWRETFATNILIRDLLISNIWIFIIIFLLLPLNYLPASSDKFD